MKATYRPSFVSTSFFTSGYRSAASSAPPDRDSSYITARSCLLRTRKGWLLDEKGTTKRKAHERRRTLNGWICLCITPQKQKPSSGRPVADEGLRVFSRRVLFHRGFQSLAGDELRNGLRFDLDLRAGLRISALAGFPLADLEGTESDKGHILFLLEGLCDAR
jgi:hypothetical protein